MLADILSAQTPLDWFTTITALVYVVLAARNNPWCWVFGAIACATWAYLDIAVYDLYSDAILQGFYVMMSGVGIYHWQFGQDKAPLPIRRMTLNDHLLLLTIGTLSGVALGYFVGDNFPAAATYWDAVTTTFSVGATFFLLQRKLENWIYWVIIDLVYIGIYYSREAWFFAALMVIYVGVALWGFFNWQSQHHAQSVRGGSA